MKLRAKRLGIDGENISILSETNAENIVGALAALEEKSLVIVDSIQTLSSSDLEGMAGSVGQIRHSAEILIAAAKTQGIPMIIIGHVTKEGGYRRAQGAGTHGRRSPVPRGRAVCQRQNPADP